MEALECVTGNGWSMVGFVFVAVFFMAVGFWARKYWGKKDPAGLASADQKAKDLGNRL